MSVLASPVVIVVKLYDQVSLNKHTGYLILSKPRQHIVQGGVEGILAKKLIDYALTSSSTSLNTMKTQIGSYRPVLSQLCVASLLMSTLKHLTRVSICFQLLTM